MGGNDRKLEANYRQGKDNNEELKSDGKTLDEERGEERMGLWGYDRKDGIVIKGLKVIENNR